MHQLDQKKNAHIVSCRVVHSAVAHHTQNEGVFACTLSLTRVLLALLLLAVVL